MCFLSQWPFFSVDASDLNVALLSGMIPWNQDYRKFLLKTFFQTAEVFLMGKIQNVSGTKNIHIRRSVYVRQYKTDSINGFKQRMDAR